MRVDPERAEAYRQSCEAWQEQLPALHRALVEGEPLLGLDGALAADDPFANVS